MGPISSGPTRSVPLEPLTPPDTSSRSDLSASDIVEKLMDTVSFAILSITDKKSRVVSSASLAPVLGMVLACMKDNAKKELLLKIPPGSLTEELEMEIHQKLGEFSKDRPYDETGKIISAANFVGTASVTTDQYLDRILSECYQTQTLEIDKENVADAADTFVKKKTKEKIKHLFDDLTEFERNQVSLVLGNVMEIQGVWREGFPLDRTASGRFLCANGTIKNVRKMRTKENLHFSTNGVFTAIAKDFRSENGEDLKLVAITPNKTSATAINKLDSETINHLIGKLDENETEIRLDLPIIEVKNSGDNELLEKITDALGTSITAQDLSRLNPSPTYKLRMVQKIKVSVDEQGAHSAIATAAAAASRGGEDIFNIDCPSYIAIVGSKGNRLLEMVIKDDSFLVPDGSPVITIPEGRKDDDPWHDDLSDDDMSDDEAIPSTLTSLPPSKHFQTVDDVSALIQRGLNPNGELNISRVKLVSNNQLYITVDTVDTANKVKQKVFELIDEKEHNNYVQVWKRLEPVQVEVSFKAWEALCDKLLHDDNK